MNNMMGIILSGGKNNGLKELTHIRSSAAVPIFAKYRTIDFIISNMINSGIVNVGILAQYNYRSLMDHLGSGKEWDLDRKNDGLFLFPPYLNRDDTGWYKGTADAIYSNIKFIERSDEDFVVISSGNTIFKTDFNELLDYHIKKNADITIMSRYMDDHTDTDLKKFGQIQIDEDNKITNFAEKPLNEISKLCSMGVYIIKRELLIDLIQDSVSHGDYDFVYDIIIKRYNELEIYSYIYEGYFRKISQIDTYFKSNMELLNPKLLKEIFVDKGKIYTKVKDEVPAKYNEEAFVSNSIVADGCIIEGVVENSILSRGVVVSKGVVIKNSIIMQDSVISKNSSLDYVIIDKEVTITDGKVLKGEETWPIIISKGSKV